MRPVIGITSYVEEVEYGTWREDAAFVPYSYVRAVERAGGRPLLVPPATEDAAGALDALDGVIFSGGGDVDPAVYGADREAETGTPNPTRDAGELELLRAALERDVPVLAVCRGSQLLNVVRGGDLVQHLPNVVGHERHRHTPGAFADHEVRLDPASRVASLLGEHAAVKSHHHQGYGRIGDGLAPAAWADDGTIEALEDPARRFAVGVLWHPEEGEDFALFRALVEEAAQYRAQRTR